MASQSSCGAVAQTRLGAHRRGTRCRRRCLREVNRCGCVAHVRTGDVVFRSSLKEVDASDLLPLSFLSALPAVQLPAAFIKTGYDCNLRQNLWHLYKFSSRKSRKTKRWGLSQFFAHKASMCTLLSVRLLVRSITRLKRLEGARLVALELFKRPRDGKGTAAGERYQTMKAAEELNRLRAPRPLEACLAATCNADQLSSAPPALRVQGTRVARPWWDH
jgi:hypothetical protein